MHVQQTISKQQTMKLESIVPQSEGICKYCVLEYEMKYVQVEEYINIKHYYTLDLSTLTGLALIFYM